LAALATTAARTRSPRGSSSAIHAVSAPAPKPAAKPLRMRAGNSHATLFAKRNSSALKKVMPVAISVAGRRPIWSESRPKKNSTARLPITYTA